MNRSATTPGCEQQHERQAQRRAGDERHRERAEQDRERPGERGRGAAQPERAGDDGAREQQDPGREREPQQRHRSSSSGIRPEASQRGSVAVHPSALVAEDDAAQPQRPAQQPPGALGVADAAVLGEEAQVAAHVLAEHAAAVRGAADVDALRAGKEAHLPAGVAEALAPVRLLAEEEEGLVERADLLDRLAAHEHARAHHDLDLALRVVVEAAA